MITLSKIKDAVLDAGKRILKVQQYGVKTAMEVSSFGDDSNPIKGMTALYAKTAESGEAVIIGYINENQIAAIGEKRLYSLDATTGEISFYMHLKNNGTAEIGGNVDNLIRYIPLDAALQAHTALINVQLAAIAASIGNLGGVYIPTPLTINVSGAKIEEVKCL
jgi:hypothetical protein